MSAEQIFATPQPPASLSDCYFYHTMEIPEHGVVKGEWDLRPNIDRYLGQVDVKGKRVLDVGAASGFLSFHMEQNGAEVVSYDLSSKYDFDAAPSRYSYQRAAREYRDLIRQLNNGYWLSHQALGSKTKMVYGTVYNIPREIGTVEIAVFGCILLHLRDPFLALRNVLQLTTEKVIIVEPAWNSKRRLAMNLLSRLAGPCMVFAPDWWKAEPQLTWWRLNPAIVERFAAALGFEKAGISYHKQTYMGVKHLLYTVVAERKTRETISS